MHRNFVRIPAHFYRVSLHTDSDSMTLALVPDQAVADRMAQLLTEHYGLRAGERIVIAPTVIRPFDDEGVPHIELTLVE